MSRDSLTVAIAALLLLSVTATAGLCYWFLQCSRQHQIAQSEWSVLSRRRALLQALGTETAEYSKRNPAILPVLQSLGKRASATNSEPAR